SGFGEIPNAEIIGPDRAAPRWDAEFEELFRVLQPICSFPERPALSFCVSRSLEEREGRSKPNRRCNQPHAERESTRQRGKSTKKAQRSPSHDTTHWAAMPGPALAAVKSLRE